MKRHLLTIGEVARRLHLSVDKVRQLSDDSELRAQRTEGGHRRFTEEAVERYVERQGTRSTRTRTQPGRRSAHGKPHQAALAIDVEDDLLDDVDIFEDWAEPEQPLRPVAPPSRPDPVRPIAPAIPSVVKGPHPAPKDDTAAEEARRKSREEAQRLQDLKNYGSLEIPCDLPAPWRAKVVEELESYVTSERLPAWVSWLEQRNLARGRVEAIVKAYRQQVAQEKEGQRAEEQRKAAAARAKAEAERRVAEIISHGMAYANQELNDFDVRDRWEIRPEVEKALQDEVRADWGERDVEDLVDDVLDDWGEDSD